MAPKKRKSKPASVAKAARLLKRADNILIITHVRPDGDTLGSAFALMYALEDMGKRVCVACDSKITKKFLFLTGEEDLEPRFKPDFIVAVDIASPQLLGKSMEEFADRIDLVIDHHPTNTRFARWNLVADTSSAAGIVVFRLLQKMRAPFSQRITDAIYVAVSTDTGCFRYSNTDAETLRIAAALVENGADSEHLNQILFEVVSPGHVALQGLALKTLHYFANGKIAIIRVTLDLIAKAKATDDDIDNISNLARNIEGVEVGLSFREVAPDEFKISARSNGDVDVAHICSLFGGGGHKRAAGCQLKGEINEVEGRIVTAILNEYFSDEDDHVENAFTGDYTDI